MRVKGAVDPMTMIATPDLNPARCNDLLLRETNHRASNDLQLVVSLLRLQSRRAASLEVRQAFTDAIDRVSILARARTTLQGSRQSSLAAALEQVCEAMRMHAEPRSIAISLQADDDAAGLSQEQVTTLTLVVNELITNAVKHAFDDRGGQVRIRIGRTAGGDISVAVEDDGCPFPDQPRSDRSDGGGLGLNLAQRLMASIGGGFTPPSPGSKVFELRVAPARPDVDAEQHESAY